MGKARQKRNAKQAARSSGNEGIIITGGTIKAEQVVVGKNASAVKIMSTAKESLEQKGLHEIWDKLEQLEKTLNTYGSTLENRDEINGAAKEIAKELSKEKPNKITVTGILEGVANGVKSVANIATSVEALKKVIMAFL